MQCHFCGTTVTFKGRLEFRARCEKCDRPLHSCVHCRFYDKSAYNQCRETKAERVVEKERGNRCEYFEAALQGKKSSGDDNNQQAFDQLFNI